MPTEQELMSVASAPGTLAGMPGAVAFAHHLHDAAVLMDEVVRRNLAGRIAQPCFGAGAGLHAGIVQDDHVGRSPSRRGPKFGDTLTSALGIVGQKAAHACRRPRSIIS